MAETGFNPASVTAVSATDNREKIVERNRQDSTRIQPVEEQDGSGASKSPAEQMDQSERYEVVEQKIQELSETPFANSRLKITQDNTSGEYVYLMIDDESGETVRRWPPEKHSDLLEYLRTSSAGLINQRV